MDTHLFKRFKMHNGFELKRLFNITAKEASKQQIKTLTRYTEYYKLYRFFFHYFPRKKTERTESHNFDFNPRLLKENGDFYYDGIWQDHRYFDAFKRAIMKEFTWKKPLDKKNSDTLDSLRSSLAVSLHIRRGDYLLHDNYKGICQQEYYHHAIDYVKKAYGHDLRFVIFSNDMAWCHENIAPMLNRQDFLYADWNTGMESYKDMRLMSACRVNIIANSSFSWWAAYMNQHPDKEIIAPKKWTNKDVHFDRQMPDWTLFEG